MGLIFHGQSIASWPLTTRFRACTYPWGRILPQKPSCAIDILKPTLSEFSTSCTWDAKDKKREDRDHKPSLVAAEIFSIYEFWCHCWSTSLGRSNIPKFVSVVGYFFRLFRLGKPNSYLIDSNFFNKRYYL